MSCSHIQKQQTLRIPRRFTNLKQARRYLCTAKNNNMIQEIFITTPDHQLLLGNPSLYRKPTTYPVHVLSDSKLSQLQVNDVVLAILHRNMDDFSAAKYLKDLKEFLESKIASLTSLTVNSNYFAIQEYLQGIHSDLRIRESSILDYIPSDDIYIDVVESVYTVIGPGNYVLQNAIQGNIIPTGRRLHDIRMSIDKSSRYISTYSTDYGMTENENSIEVTGKKILQPTVLISYYIQKANDPIMSMSRTGNKYEFISTVKSEYKFLIITIPVSPSTYQVRIKAESGKATFFMDKGQVQWEFIDNTFERETITIEEVAYDSRKNDKPVLVRFNIPKYTDGAVKVRHSQCTESAQAKFWIRYSTQDGHYEIHS